MGLKNRRAGGGATTAKNPPMMSHEFIIQNHADIVSCIAMVFVVGLMFQVTAPLSSLFVAVHHNATDMVETAATVKGVNYYTYGIKDLSCIFFYFLISIIVHAVIQEYVLDRANRKLHLSKVNHRKFDESGQLVIFYLISVVWGLNIMAKEGLIYDISGLWSNYPDSHSAMTFQHKFFFILQIAYWIHQFPELYFQKIKRDEMMHRVQYSVQYLIVISTAYILNYSKLCLFLLVPHYAAEVVFYVARILYFAEKQSLAKRAFTIRNFLFVPVRLGSLVVSVLMFHFGLAKEKEGLDLATGNFNTQLLRINCLVCVSFLQAIMLWNFINFHMKKRRDSQTTVVTKKAKGGENKKAKKDKSKKPKEENDLPEADQNTILRQRKVVPTAATK